MKFAKELDRELVPEWRAKYLDYKGGKKKLKAITRALRRADQTPSFRRRGAHVLPGPYDAAPQYSFINRERAGGDATTSRGPEDLKSLAQTSTRHTTRRLSYSPDAQVTEVDALAHSQGDTRSMGSGYGSINGVAGKGKQSSDEHRSPSLFKLPSAALDADHIPPEFKSAQAPVKRTRTGPLPPAEMDVDTTHASGSIKSPKYTHRLPLKYKSIFTPQRVNSMPGPIVQTKARPAHRRIFSLSHKIPPTTPSEAPVEAYRDLDLRQAEFFNFLDAELDKIETFYKEKEDEATLRLSALHEQLHIMRDRRLDDIIARQTAKIKAKAIKNYQNTSAILDDGSESPKRHSSNGYTLKKGWMDPFDAAIKAIQAGKYGKSTKSFAQLASPSGLGPQDHLDFHARKDYVRKPEQSDVTYQVAKRKLKVALQEYYRGLELLKAYTLLNRTAFRKINKKYDKTVNARPAMRFVTEKVNQAWFVSSDVIESHIRATEDLYARYFEKGNHKVAVGKLRIKIARAGDYTDNTFRNGILLATGLILGIEGAVKATSIADLRNMSDSFAVNTSYLLQIYGGFFLINLLMIFFCLACKVWHESKINYVFIFEYDTRHNLDWRQLSELPCWYVLMLGLCMQFNFFLVGGLSMYLWWPVVLVGSSALMLFNPIKIFYFRTRMWLLYSLWRLILAGLYPVEWRDFFLGDMFCSLTYSMGNIALFFCLYIHDWYMPNQCNSSHLRIMGFMTTLPGVWRALQCVRRYWDTGNKFPHLLNCGKYIMTIVYYVTLSIYRINKNKNTHAAFITFAVMNSIYTSFWDIYYDWSLGDASAKRWFLRNELGYKKVWWYYAAMIIDPILRFNWIIYLISPLQIQHSAVSSFVMSVTEVCRRGVWSLFRVENEHCTNVGRFRASRDVPLPYNLGSAPPGIARGEAIDEEQPARSSTAQDALASSTGVSHVSSHASLRSRPHTAGPPSMYRVFTHVGDIFRNAHAQDFERKRKPELGVNSRNTSEAKNDSDDDDSTGDERSIRSGNEDSPEDFIESEDEGEPNALGNIREDVEREHSGKGKGMLV